MNSKTMPSIIKSSAGSNSAKNFAIQGFRTIAFIFVFLSHAEVLGSGPLGVSIFLVLSGFMMAISHAQDNDLSNSSIRKSFLFAACKMKKLLPLHWLTFLAMAAFNLLLLYNDGFPTQSLKEYLIAFPFNAVMLQAWLPFEELYFSFNKASCYLSVCFFSYYMFALTFRKLQTCVKRYGGRKFALLLILLVILLQLFLAGLLSAIVPGEIRPAFLKWFTYICPAYRLGDFIIGVLLGIAITCKPLPAKKLGRRLRAEPVFYTYLEVAWIVLTISCLWMYVNVSLPDTIKYNTLWIADAILGTYLFYVHKGKITKLCQCKAITFLGDISGSAFLLHQMIIHLCMFVVTNKAILTFISLAITIIASVLWLRIERLFKIKFSNK